MSKITIARNQKNYIELKCKKEVFDKLCDANIPVIIFGSNGQGKTTFKELMMHENLDKNFMHEEDEQINDLYDHFKDTNPQIFDDNYVNNFIYSDISLNSNSMRVLLKTSEINKMLLEKETRNDNINKVIKEVEEKINIIFNLKNKIKYEIESRSKKQKIFAQTIFKDGTEDSSFRNLNNENYSWWLDGYKIFLDLEKEKCPWCNSKYNDFSTEIKEIVDKDILTTKNVSSQEEEYKKAQNFLIILQSDNDVSKNTKDKATEILELMNESRIVNHSETILSLFEEIIKNIQNDINILSSLKTNLNNLKNNDLQPIFQIKSGLDNLKFLKNGNEIKNIKKEIEIINENILEINRIIKDSNQQILDKIKPSIDYINKIINKFGLNLKFEISKNILDVKNIDELTEYVVIKNINEENISNRIGNILSYGEHTTLAFAIFIASIYQQDYDKKTPIIFDDPISSYDIYRRSMTTMEINNLIREDYKNLFIFTHENNFVMSLLNLNLTEKLILTIKDENNYKILEDEDIDSFYFKEIDFYKEMINNDNLLFEALAIRKIAEFLKSLKGSNKYANLFYYLCSIIHYRKAERISSKGKIKDQLINLLDFLGINKSEDQINKLLDKNIMFNYIDNYYEKIKAINVLDIKLEDLLTLRTLAEKAVRDNESELGNDMAYKNQDLWDFESNRIRNDLYEYAPYLNSICHVDDERFIDIVFNSIDFRYIPLYIKNKILNIIFNR